MSDKEQMNLFREVPTKIKYLLELPNCGVCQKEQAVFHAPTKFGIWADICQKCSESNTDGRFSLGYKLAQHTPTGGPLRDVVEINDIMLVATNIRPRIIACEVCHTKRKIKKDFIGVIICRSCVSRLRVNKLC